MSETSLSEDIFNQLREACESMRIINSNEATRSRELSVAITELETAIMWFNKDRAVKGEFPPSATHV